MELELVNLFKELPYIVSFIAGILTFLSPCILPLIPPYMSYISGISLEELKTNSLKARIYIFQRAILFVAGFSLVFILIGISFNTILGSILSNPITNYIAGGIIIIFGIHFLGIVRFNILYKTKRVDLKHSTTRKAGTIGFLIHTISPLILGIGFALGWSPCVGPILSSIMILSSTDRTSGLSLMVVYAIGLSIPFLLTALAIERFFTLFNKIKKYARTIEIISGILLIIIGLTIAFGGMDKLNEILV